MRIRLLDLAERDLAAGARFYEAQREGLGGYFLDALFSDIDALALYAGIHLREHGLHRALSRRFPYAIYYAMADDELRVCAVLDCRRDPGWIRKHLTNG